MRWAFAYLNQLFKAADALLFCVFFRGEKLSGEIQGKFLFPATRAQLPSLDLEVIHVHADMRAIFC